MRVSLILLFVLSLSTIQAQSVDTQNPDTSNFLEVTRYRLTPEDLKIQQEINEKKVYLKIYYNNQGSVADDFTYFKPKKNEILFFYGLNPENQKTEMFFKVHDTLKPIYKKKDFDQMMEVVKVLQYNVFSTEKFSSAEAYAALERH